MKRAIFITGTDTGIGKTVVSGLLAKYILEKGESVITQKWIQTGSSDMPLDIKTHLKIMGKNKDYIKGHLNDVCPYVFKFSASPHLASKIEGRLISEEKIIKSFKRLSSEFDWVIVEGTGGVLVPFSSKSLIIDLAVKLDLEVLLVAVNLRVKTHLYFQYLYGGFYVHRHQLLHCRVSCDFLASKIGR